MAHGEINDIELPADDVERAKAFYTAVAGWQFSSMDGVPDYWLFRTSEGYGGAIGKRGISTGPAVRDYIEVDSIDDALAASDRTGGTTKEPNRDRGHGLVRGRNRPRRQRDRSLPGHDPELTLPLRPRSSGHSGRPGSPHAPTSARCSPDGPNDRRHGLPRSICSRSEPTDRRRPVHSAPRRNRRSFGSVREQRRPFGSVRSPMPARAARGPAHSSKRPSPAGA